MVFYNEVETLRSALQRIETIFKTFPDLEVILVGNCPSLESSEIAIKFKKRMIACTLLLQANSSLGAARNLILNASKTLHVLIVDPDCEYQIDQIEKIYTGFFETLYDFPLLASVGLGSQASEDHLLGACYNLMTSTVIGHLNSPQAAKFLSSKMVEHNPFTFVLVFVPIIKLVGGVRNEFSKVCEDTELGVRLNEVGFSCVVLGGSVVIHHLSANWISWCQRMFRFGRAQWHVIAQHPQHFTLRLALPLAFLPFMALSFVYVPKLLFIYSGFLIAVTFPNLLREGRVGTRKKGGNVLLVLFTTPILLLLTHCFYAFGETLGLLEWVWFKAKLPLFSGARFGNS